MGGDAGETGWMAGEGISPLHAGRRNKKRSRECRETEPGERRDRDRDRGRERERERERGFNFSRGNGRVLVRTTTSLIISDSFFFHLPFRDCRMLPATDAVAAVVAPLENPRRRGLVANRTATREFHFPLCLLLLCASHFSFSIIAIMPSQ